MSEFVTVCLAGLTAGAIHALSGPDHFAAVTPLSLSSRARAWQIGVRWGLGHAVGIGLVGAGVFFLRGLLYLETVSWWSERAVGLMLIGIGLWGLRRASSRWVHAHVHEHSGEAHVHIHVHDPNEAHESAAAHEHPHAAVGMGVLHGVAGASHLFGVLPALALPTRLAAASYLCAFGTGNLVAMGGLAWLVGLASERLARSGVGLYRAALATCSAAALAVGVLWSAF